MNCWRVQNLVAPFLDGELPDAECEAVGAHIEACPECLALVESVESLPPIAAPRLPEALEGALLDDLDALLAERLAAGVAPEDEARAGLGGRIAGMARREVRMPAAVAAAWIGAMVILSGGVALNHTRVQDLEDSVARREAIIQALQERVAVADARSVDGDEAPGRTMTPVFLPASAPSALGSTLPPRRGPYAMPGIVGASTRQASWDAPRVVR